MTIGLTIRDPALLGGQPSTSHNLTHVNDALVTNTTGTTIALTMASLTASVGDLMAVSLSYFCNQVAGETIVAPLVDTWQVATSVVESDSLGFVGIYWRVKTGTEQATQTWSGTSTGAHKLLVASSFNDTASGTWAIDQHISLDQSSTGTQTTTTSITPVQAMTAAVAASITTNTLGTQGNTGSHTMNNGFTVTSANDAAGVNGWLITSSASAFTEQMVWTQARSRANSIATWTHN